MPFLISDTSSTSGIGSLLVSWWWRKSLWVYNVSCVGNLCWVSRGRFYVRTKVFPSAENFPPDPWIPEPDHTSLTTITSNIKIMIIQFCFISKFYTTLTAWSSAHYSQFQFFATVLFPIFPIPLRRDFKLILWSRSVIGWRFQTRYLIGWERHLTSISLKTHLIWIVVIGQPKPSFGI